MENVKILIDGIQKEVYGLFYIYESKYYFIYTEKEVDENNYVILYISQVGKETKNTENGPVDTGYMVGVEITNPEEQQKVQASISYIVEDKKNNTISSQIQYLPMSMLTNLKIVSKKRFRLLKSIMVDNFKLQFDSIVTPVIEIANQPVDNVINSTTPTISQPITSGEVSVDQSVQPIQPVPLDSLVQPVQQVSQVESSNASNQIIKNLVNNSNSINTTDNTANDVNVIVDYRSKYFEEEEKNKELQAEIEELTRKLNEIKKVIE